MKKKTLALLYGDGSVFYCVDKNAVCSALEKSGQSPMQ